VDRHDLAVQGTNDGIWDWDLTTSRIHYSHGWISLLGLGEGEFDNTPEEWFRRIHPEDILSVKREIETHLQGKSARFEIQHRMLHHDGCYRWLSCRGIITRNDEGRATRIRGIHKDITSEKAVDSLTGLPNRLLLLERLTRSIERARKQQDFLFGILILDLDLFESGISRLETLNCDSLVIAAARRLETALRTRDSLVGAGHADLIARSGGEEFIILLEGLSEVGEAKRVAERLLKVILAPFTFNGREVSLSASIGIALSVTGYRAAEEALRDADTALHRSKAFGKCRCEVFDTAALQSTQVRNQTEKELHGALARNEFLVCYQPILLLASNKIAGFEVLVRWNHPSRGMILPSEFIPIAEKTGLINILNRWVMQQACRQLKTWRMDPRISKDLWISLNLSSAQFLHPDLVNEISEILSETGLDADGLLLELTEGTVMQNPEEARRLLMQLRLMGARIGLDDFGTGYSSLSYLRRFPLDFLKIDYSFIRSIESGSDPLEIIRTICRLGHQLGLRIIAEGIENPRQLDLVRSLDCEFGQGFLFSKAVSSEQAETLLVEGFIPREEARPAESEPDATQEPARKPGFKIKRKYACAGLTLLALLLLAGFLARLNRPNASPVAYTSPPAAAVKLEKPSTPSAIQEVEPKPLAPETQKASKMYSGLKTPAPAPKAEMRKAAPAVYRFPVVHDHRLGSCEGVLRIGSDGIAFIANNGKHSFALKHSECRCIMDPDQLTIRSGSMVFRFKSDSLDQEGNRTKLSEIYRSITKLNPSTEPGNADSRR
jgi:diguanylate cyclase (GGDEF)-like protein/PAS domain S-box-containing protein